MSLLSRREPLSSPSAWPCGLLALTCALLLVGLPGAGCGVGLIAWVIWTRWRGAPVGVLAQSLLAVIGLGLVAQTVERSPAGDLGAEFVEQRYESFLNGLENEAREAGALLAELALDTMPRAETFLRLSEVHRDLGEGDASTLLIVDSTGRGS